MDQEKLSSRLACCIKTEIGRIVEVLDLLYIFFYSVK